MAFGRPPTLVQTSLGPQVIQIFAFCSSTSASTKLPTSTQHNVWSHSGFQLLHSPLCKSRCRLDDDEGSIPVLPFDEKREDTLKCFDINLNVSNSFHIKGWMLGILHFSYDHKILMSCTSFSVQFYWIYLQNQRISTSLVLVAYLLWSLLQGLQAVRIYCADLAGNALASVSKQIIAFDSMLSVIFMHCSTVAIASSSLLVFFQ